MKHKLLARYPIGNPNRVWRQDNFVLSLASPGPMDTKFRPKSEYTRRKTRRAVKTSFEAGFTVLGCLWADSELAMDIVRAAEALDGSVLFQDLCRYGGMGHKNVFTGGNNDFEGALKDLRRWKSIKGHIMWDEPILEEHLEETRRMIDYCEREYPDLLPYTVANPDYHKLCRWEDRAYAPYIERFLDVIDPAEMSFDYYPIGKREYDPVLQLDNSTMWSCLEIVRRAAQKRNIPFWFWYQGQHFTWHKINYVFRHDMARMMAFAGALHGAKALECYTEFDAFVDPETGGHGADFEAQKKLNTELKNLGGTLMALECLRVIHDDTLLPDHPAMEGLRTSMEESELLTGTLAPRISASEHQDAYGNRYLMVLNRDYDTAKHVSLTMKNPSNIYEVKKEDGEQYLLYEREDKPQISLTPGELRLFRIQPADEELCTIEYYLEK